MSLLPIGLTVHKQPVSLPERESARERGRSEEVRIGADQQVPLCPQCNEWGLLSHNRERRMFYFSLSYSVWEVSLQGRAELGFVWCKCTAYPRHYPPDLH